MKSNNCTQQQTRREHTWAHSQVQRFTCIRRHAAQSSPRPAPPQRRVSSDYIKVQGTHEFWCSEWGPLGVGGQTSEPNRTEPNRTERTRMRAQSSLQGRLRPRAPASERLCECECVWLWRRRSSASDNARDVLLERIERTLHAKRGVERSASGRRRATAQNRARVWVRVMLRGERERRGSAAPTWLQIMHELVRARATTMRDRQRMRSKRIHTQYAVDEDEDVKEAERGRETREACLEYDSARVRLEGRAELQARDATRKRKTRGAAHTSGSGETDAAACCSH